MRVILGLLLALASFGFASNTESVLMSAGVANEVYRVNSSKSKPYILKVFHRKTIEELDRAESLLQLVRMAGILVPDSIIPPIQLDSKVISVISYVNGSHIDDRHLSEVAKLMAKLHLIKIVEDDPIPLKDYDLLFERCKGWEYCEVLKEIFTELDLSYLDNLPRGLIHGDFSYSNLLVDQDSQLTLLDFDHLRKDILLTDLVRCHLFYGFNQKGELKEEVIRNFVSTYNTIRPIKMEELDVFYTHMKLCFIQVALEMYYHMYVEKDLPLERVDGNPYNACLTPDLIAKEILLIRDKSSITIDQQTAPIFFFGLAGVGKTTLIHLLKDSSDLFYIPKFTVTRPARDDDDPRYFEYVSVEEFLRMKDLGEFFVWMNQEGTYYGYQFKDLNSPNQYPLLNASAYGIDLISSLRGVKVLIEGNENQGLALRNNPEIAKTKEKVNRLAYERFFSQESFLKKMDIIYLNQFGDPKRSAVILKKQILEEIEHDAA